jgi:hypothetical protein
MTNHAADSKIASCRAGRPSLERGGIGQMNERFLREKMRSTAEHFMSLIAASLAIFSMQVRVALSVGLPSEVESNANLNLDSRDGSAAVRSTIRSLDDYAGYLTRNGLGSLDVGGGRSRWGE